MDEGGETRREVKMKSSLLMAAVILLFLVCAHAQEGSVKSSVVEEEMQVRSALPNRMSETGSKTSLVAEDEKDKKEIINIASHDSGQDAAAASVDTENQEERSVSTKPLTYYGYKEASSEVYDEIYNYYSLSYPKESREWQ
jgi:hypothetical protein